MRKPEFNVFRSQHNNRWYWNLEAGNGEIILKTSDSAGFVTVEEAQEAISETRKALRSSVEGQRHIERFTGDDGNKYFRVISGSSNLAVSEGYEGIAGRDNGINAALAAHDAKVFVK